MVKDVYFYRAIKNKHTMKAKIEIGTHVEGKKGTGIITSIITKSTGYVEVTWDNGNKSKEMAFNLTVNGESLKSKPESKSKLNPANFMSAEEYAKSKYSTMSNDDFNEERKRDRFNTISW